MQKAFEVSSNTECPEYSVSEVAGLIKSTIEQRFEKIRVKGEVTGLVKSSAGHIYFTLKDEKSVLHVTCWKGSAEKLEINLIDGLEVVCIGKLSTYPSRSIYQLNSSDIKIAGVGTLLQMLELRKKMLAKAGFFDQARKKSIPYIPKVIGVVTSFTGAVICDILHRISERFPAKVIVWGVQVQGVDSAKQVSNAIQGFNNLPPHIFKPDVLIVARGGGSIEDLWSFNEEIIVHAVYNSDIPIISAIGHETDTTLIDYAADLRAPTPTAAAEFATPVFLELKRNVDNLEVRLHSIPLRIIAHKQLMLHNVWHKLKANIQALIKIQSQLDNMSIRLKNAISNYLRKTKNEINGLENNLNPYILVQLNQLRIIQYKHLEENMAKIISNVIQYYKIRLHNTEQLLESFHYKKILARGFAIVRDNQNHQILTSVQEIESDKILEIEVADGKFTTYVR